MYFSRGTCDNFIFLLIRGPCQLFLGPLFQLEFQWLAGQVDHKVDGLDGLIVVTNLVGLQEFDEKNLHIHGGNSVADAFPSSMAKGQVAVGWDLLAQVGASQPALR